QLANAILEDMSARDTFWFHHILGLRCDTTSAQLRSLIAEIGDLLKGEPAVDTASVRVSLLKVGVASLDLELVAYVRTPDILAFFAIQENLLLLTLDLIERTGVRIAVPIPFLSAAAENR